MEPQTRLELATQIFAEHGPAIRAMIRRHAGDPAEEEDLYQNLYLSLMCSPAPAPLTNTLAYLNTVIKNDIIDAARRRRSYHEMIGRYATNRTHDEKDHNPEEEVIQAEQVQQIAKYIETSLPAHEARAIAERYGDSQSTTEAALRMSVKERTVSRYLCLGLKHIREALASPEAVGM